MQPNHKRENATRQTVLVLIVLALLSLAVMFPNIAAWRDVPHPDSGVFLYEGQQILHGEVPYRDIWDHKPPAIYYIDAFGLLIGHGSIWGLWLLEFIAIYSAVVLGFILMRRALGMGPAILGSVAWLISMHFVNAGNFPEEFSLPFIFAAMYLFWQSEKAGRYSWRGFLIGLIGSFCFLLKPTLIAVPLAIVLFVGISRIRSRRWGSLVADLAPIIVGAFSMIIVVLSYFAANNALGDFYDQVFKFNYGYTSTPFTEKALTLYQGLSSLSPSGISILALVAWILGIFYIKYEKEKLQTVRPLVCLALIAAPIDLILVSYAGITFGSHYYITWLPIFGILTGFFAYVLSKSVTDHFSSEVKLRPVAVWMVALLIVVSSPTAAKLAYDIGLGITNWHEHAAPYETVEYIRQYTGKNNYILVWGHSPGIYFASDRQAATRYIYQMPLLTQAYANEQMIDEFLNNLMTNKPTLIIDTSSTKPSFPPLNSTDREKWLLGDSSHELNPEMEVVFDYIASNYELARKIPGDYLGTTGLWSIYKLVGEGSINETK